MKFPYRKHLAYDLFSKFTAEYSEVEWILKSWVTAPQTAASNERNLMIGAIKSTKPTGTWPRTWGCWQEGGKPDNLLKNYFPADIENPEKWKRIIFGNF